MILFLIGVTAYAHDYKGSKIYSKEEISYIEKLQKEGLKLGASLGSLYINPKDPQDSLEHKYELLLEEFFHIDVELVKGEWNEVYQKLKNDEIDLLLNFTLSEERRDYHWKLLQTAQFTYNH